MCLLAMAAVNRLLKRQYIYITSMVGAIFHNIGQVGVAILILQMPGILVYVPFLILSGVVTGLFTGLALHYFEKYIPRTMGRIL